jgi:hypothetical protein
MSGAPPHTTQGSAGAGVRRWRPLGAKPQPQPLRARVRAEDAAAQMSDPVEIGSEFLIPASIAGSLGVTGNRGHGFRILRYQQLHLGEEVDCMLGHQ